MNGLSEAVIVCRGNLTDPAFFLYLAKVKTKLQKILSTDKESLQVEKVEKWNSVRVTFRLPVEAASRLRQLSIRHPHHLGQLGIRSVTVDGSQVNATLGPATLLSNASTSNGSDSGFDSGSASAASAPEICGEVSNGPTWTCPAPAPLPSDTSRRNVLHYLMHNDTPGTSQQDPAPAPAPHCPTATDVFRVPSRPVASPAGVSRSTPVMTGQVPYQNPQPMDNSGRTMVNSSPLLVGLLRSQSPGGTISQTPQADYYLGPETGDTTQMGQVPPYAPPYAARAPQSAAYAANNNRYSQDYVQSSYVPPYVHPQQPHPQQAGYYHAPQQTQPLVPNCDDAPPPKKPRKRTSKKKAAAQQQQTNPYVEVSYQPSTSQPPNYPQPPVRPQFNPQDRPMWSMYPGGGGPPQDQSGRSTMPPPHSGWPPHHPPPTSVPPSNAPPFFGSQPPQPHNLNPASHDIDRGADLIESQQTSHQTNSGPVIPTASPSNRPSSRQRVVPNPASDEHIKSSIEAVLDQCKHPSSSSIPTSNNQADCLPGVSSNGPAASRNSSFPSPHSGSTAIEALRATSPVISSESQLLERLKGQLRSSITPVAPASVKGTSHIGSLTNGGFVENGINDRNSEHSPPVSPRSLIQKLPNPIISDRVDSKSTDDCYGGFGLCVSIPPSEISQGGCAVTQANSALSSVSSNYDSPNFNTGISSRHISRTEEETSHNKMRHMALGDGEQPSPASSTGSSNSSKSGGRSRRKCSQTTSELVRHSLGVMDSAPRGRRSRDSSNSSTRLSTREQSVDRDNTNNTTCRISLEPVAGNSGKVGH